MPRKALRVALIAAVLTVLGVLGWAAFDRTRPMTIRDPKQVHDLELAVRAHVLRWAREGRLARPDGDVKAVEVGQLLTYAGRAGDRELYPLLRDFCVQHLIVNDPKEEFTRGMVLWRYRPGMPADASGTTEALRIAEGLWRGAKTVGHPADRVLALLIIRAYGRHAWINDDGIWLVRNYYNLGDPSKPGRPGAHFVTNTFLVDYDPDFLAEVAREVGDADLAALARDYPDRLRAEPFSRADLADLAERSLALVKKARTPVGLIYDCLQPEFGTLTDGSLIYFSPNDVGQLSNIATVAERVSRGAPGLADGVLDFCLKRSCNLNLYYYCRTGQAAHYHPPGCELYGPLVRLAVNLHNQKALDAFLPPLVTIASNFVKDPRGESVFLASEMLLALRAAGEQMEAQSGGGGGRVPPPTDKPPGTQPEELIPPGLDQSDVE